MPCRLVSYQCFEDRSVLIFKVNLLHIFSSDAKVTIYQQTRYMIPVFIHLKSYIREGNTSNLRVYENLQAYLKKIFGPKRNKVVYKFLASVCTQVEMARGNISMVGVTPCAGSVTIIKQVARHSQETKCPAVFLCMLFDQV